MSSITIYAGAKARQHIAKQGLQASDITAIAAAAGGPKGLAMMPLDHYLFGEWLPSQPRPRQAYGASIGAWRMAAGTRNNASAALTRLSEAYLERQRYPDKPTAKIVSTICREVVSDLIDNTETFITNQNSNWQLNVITAQSRHHESAAQIKRMFARAAIRNTVARSQLSTDLKRFIFESGNVVKTASPIPTDSFGQTAIQLTAQNLEDALLSSGSIPLVADPVRSIAGTPANAAYWDGGLIDYHLYWPWHQLDGLVLYPHFCANVTAGWLDKFLPWRKHGVGAQGKDWLSNIILIAPSESLIAKLPNAKLPDRNDFYTYGQDHDQRIRDWRRAMQECQRMVDDFAGFVEQPGRITIKPL